MFSKKISACVLAVLLAASSPSNGDILIKWEQLDNGVLASYSGTVTLEAYEPGPYQYDGWFVGKEYFNMSFAGEWMGWNTGTAFESSITSTYLEADLGTGNPFWFSTNAIYWDSTVGDGPLSGTLFFEGRTLEEMGATSFNHFMAFQGSDGDFAVYYQTIPEPNFMAFAGAGILGLAAFLRKKRSA